MFEKFSSWKTAFFAVTTLSLLTVGAGGYYLYTRPMPEPIPVPVPIPQPVVFEIPKQIIVNPTTDVELGELVDLSVSKIIGIVPQHLAGQGYDWKVFEICHGKNGCELKPKRFNIINEMKINFGSGMVPKKYYVECYCTYLYTVMVDGKVTEVGTKNQLLTTVVNAVGPTPTPTPPGPGPTPTPPTPTPTDLGPFGGAPGLHVLIVFETTEVDKLTKEQFGTIYGKEFRDYIEKNCVKGPDGRTPQRRIYDKDVIMLGESKLWQDAMKRSRGSIPWIAVGNGKNWVECPLPATTAEIMALIKKVNG